jgi:plasmid stabilization system protein ParE
MRVFITAAAEADLVAIGNYIRPHNPARAATFVQELLDHCYSLAEMPRRYPLVPRYERWGVRRCARGDYLIFYRIREELIEIDHILQGAMDYAALLFPDA